jgi:chromosome segregation protein
LNRYVLRREAIEERLLEEFNLTQEQMDAPVERGINREQLLSSINGLKSDIQLLGEVNLHSIKEHELVVERCTFYEEQIDDLETGRQSTLGIIAEIDAKCEIRLVKTLDEINGHIEEIFQILFGGGDVKLAFDHPEDVLNSPLDIIARPPGKKRQSIMLLSGGEKTMTALSLIFAILRVKPSPFCILDEVEAALDENNVRRFIEMLKTFTEHTQFLIITHNKVTMQYLDLLYGITMEEKGMSNVISVKLEEAIEMSEEFEPKMKLSETGLSEGMKLKTAKVAVA